MPMMAILAHLQLFVQLQRHHQLSAVYLSKQPLQVSNVFTDTYPLSIQLHVTSFFLIYLSFLFLIFSSSSVKPSPSGTVVPAYTLSTPELVAIIAVPLCLLVMVLTVVIVLNSLLMWMRWVTQHAYCFNYTCDVRELMHICTTLCSNLKRWNSRCCSCQRQPAHQIKVCNLVNLKLIMVSSCPNPGLFINVYQWYSK